MKSLVQALLTALIFLVLAVENVENTLRVEVHSVEIFDELKYRTGFLLQGGLVRIACALWGIPEGCQKGQNIQLINSNDQKIMQVDCDPDVNVFNMSGSYVQAFFDLPLDDTTPFDSYKCLFNGQKSALSFDFKYRLCTDSEEQCQKDCVDGTKFCIVNAAGKNPCSPFTDDMCTSPDNITDPWSACPMDNRVRTCQATVKDPSSFWYNARICTSSDNLQVTIGGKPRKSYYKETLLISRNDKEFEIINFESHSHISALNYTCELRPVSASSSATPTVAFKEKKFVIKDEIFTAGSQVYRMDWQFLKDTKPAIPTLDFVMARLTYYLVVIEGTVTVTPANNDGKTADLTCTIDPPPATEFQQIIYGWKGQKTGVLTDNGQTIKVSISDKYSCSATPVYKTCRPHRSFNKTLTSSEPVDVQLSIGNISAKVCLALIIVCVITQAFLDAVPPKRT